MRSRVGLVSEGRDRQLDGLRAVAVTLVLYAHFLAPGGSHWGHVGVRLFFVLSGFLITRLLLKARDDAAFEPATALGSFYIRRFLRIFPPYFAMLGIVWLLDLEGGREGWQWQALYLSNFWYAIRNDWSPWVLCHTWSLSIEEQFYLVWPLVMLFAPRRLIGRICVGAILLSIAYRFYWPVTGTDSLARDLLPFAHLDALAAGSLLAAYRTGNTGWPDWARLAWLPLALAFLAVLWFSPTRVTPLQDWAHWAVREVLPLLPLVMLVGACADRSIGVAGRALELPIAVDLGRISYGVYLYHGMALAFAVQAQPWLPVNVSEQGPGRFLVAGAITLIFAVVSWFTFERRIDALKRYVPYTKGRAAAVRRLGPARALSTGFARAEQPSGAER